MALIEKLNNLGDAVRIANNSSDEYTLEQMAEIVRGLVSLDSLPACEEVEW